MRKLYRYATLLLCTTHCMAQDFPALKFTQLTVKDGLSSEAVNDIIQDRRGIIWISTQDGLNRYDGTGFKTYYHDPKDSNSICDNDTRDMALDNEGLLWISTANGLCRFNPVTGRSRNYYHQTNGNSISNNYECSPFIDSRGRVWLATQQGVQLFDYKNNLFTTYSMPALPVSEGEAHHNAFRMIREDRQHRLWALSFYGVFRIDEAQQQMISYYQGTIVANISFYQASDNNIYLGQWSEGLKKFVPETRSYERSPVIGTGYSIVCDFTEWQDNSGRNWLVIALDGGIALRDLRTNQTKFYQHKTGNPFSLNTAWITKIFKDSDNRLWFASDKGVNVMDPQLQYFTNHYLYQQVNKDNPKVFGVPRSVIETDNEYILSSWYCKGLYVFDKNWNLISHKARIPESSASVHSGSINGIFRDAKGNDWFCTDSGLVKQTGNRYQVFIAPGATSIINEELSLREILPRPDGKFWIRGKTTGFYLFDPANGQFLNRYAIGEKGLQGEVSVLRFDRNNNLWIGTDSAVFILNEKQDRFERIRYKNGKGEEDFINTRDLICDEDNMIWIATQQGLGRINASNTSEAGVISGNSLPDAFLIRVQEDHQHNLWIKSLKGIIRYDKKTDFRFFTYQDGLPDFYNLYGLFEFNKEGKMLSGQAGAVTEFDPTAMILHKHNPAIVICDAAIDNKPTTIITDGDWPGIVLQPGQKTLQLHFAITSYTSAASNKFYYKIAGISNEWIQAPGGNINFTGLPIGKHKLYLKGAGNNGITSGERILEVIVQPYWYQTSLFKFIVTSATIILVVAFVSWRIRSIRKQAAFRQKIAETEMQALRAQMNPHFIFNSLNSIENFIMQNERRLASDYLNKFARLVRMILDSSRNELVLFSKDMEALQLYVDLEQLRFNHKFEYKVAVDAALMHGDYKVPPLLIQPYVENAIVHGLAHCEEDNLYVAVTATLENNNIKYVIEDNGVGRQTAGQYNKQNKPHHKSVGLTITEERINIFNKRSGANGSIVIDDLYPDRPGASGTKVQITIKAV